MEEKRDPKCCERYKVACFQTFQDIWDWESWLQNLCYKCNGKKIVQFHLTLAGTTWKRIEGDPLFEHAMHFTDITQECKISKFFHWLQKNGEKPIAYCLRGCYLCFSLIYSRRLIHRKGMAMTPTFHEVPNLPRDRESYSVSIRKQQKWGFELTYLWQASKGEELVCVRLHWPRHLFQRGAHKIVKGSDGAVPGFSHLH